jgi:hypothetical protein
MTHHFFVVHPAGDSTVKRNGSGDSGRGAEQGKQCGVAEHQGRRLTADHMLSLLSSGVRKVIMVNH